jgi:hypothetical protein
MANEYKVYSKQLDEIAKTLPNYGMCHKIQKEVWDAKHKSIFVAELFSDYVNTLEKILGYAGAADIRKDMWHIYAKRLDFKPVKSQYFKIGKLRLSDGVVFDDNLEGVLAVGFDEGGDYNNNEGPELILFYSNYDSCTDVELYNPKNWRSALAEFFDMNKIEASAKAVQSSLF